MGYIQKSNMDKKCEAYLEKLDEFPKMCDLAVAFCVK